MKKFLLSIFSILTLLTGVVFVGCGETQSASAIVLESDAFTDETNHLIEIDLTEGANVSVVVKATIEGQDNGQVQIVNDYENIVHCEVAYNQNINTNTITITALEESDETVELIVKAKSGNVEKQHILINTYSHMTAIYQKQDDDTSKKTQFIPLDEEVVLSIEKYLEITASDTCNKKDVVWGYADNNTYGDALVIVGNKLRLDSAKLENYEASVGTRINQITIKAQSKYQEALSTTVTLDVIKPIVFNAQTDFTQSYDSTFGFSSVYDNNGMKSYEVVRNISTDEHSNIYYKISFVSERAVSWVPLTDDVLFEEFGIPVETLDITKSESYNDATKTYTFTFKVKNEKSIEPANYSFNFSFAYEDYDYTLKTDNVSISLVDVVERIEVTSENNENFKDGDTIDLYNSYANKKGLFFNTNLYPTTAKDTKYFVRVAVTKELAEKEGFDLNKYFKIYTEADGLITFDKEEIDNVDDYYYFKSTQIFGNATKLYACAIDTSINSGDISLSFVSNANVNKIKTTLKLNFVYAPNEDFNLKEDAYPLDYAIETSEITTTVIEGKCEALIGRKSGDLILDYEKSDDYSISDFVFKANGEFSFNISTNKKNLNNKIEVWLCHKNGFKATKPITIEFFKALTSASVSLLNSNSNNIADYSIKSQSYGGGVDNSLESVVATFGSTLSLQLDHNASDCLKGIELYYFVVNQKGVTKDISSIFNGDKLDENKKITTDGYFSYNANLSSLTLLTTETTFTSFVVVEFSGYNASHEEIKLYRIFKVDSYVPVSTLATKSTPVEMIASDSLSAQDAETLSKKTIEVSFRTDGEKISYYSFDKKDNVPYFVLYSATAKNDKTGAYTWDETSRTLRYNGEIIYSISDIDSSDGRKLSFIINTESTKDFNEFNDIIVLEYTAFKSVYRLSIDLTIKNSDRVESVIWENETDDGELYVLTLKVGDKVTENNKATIITTVQEAYNTKLTYKYIALNGSSNVIKFEENGKNVDVVANNGASGGYGYIYVLPQDAVKKNEQVIFSYYDEDLNIITDKVQLGNLNDSCTIEGNQSMTWFEFLTQKAFFITNDGRVVSYGKILLKIKLTVADGLSEETAIRIYTSDEIQTMTSVNHYILMNSIELSGEKLYAGADTNKEAFKGSLRGYNSDIVITMKDDSSSLFGNIGESGIVRDLTFNGSVKSSFVAETNLGIISNVTIDVRIVDGNYCPSEVNGENNWGAGIVQNNSQSGKILSSKVLGAKITGQTVGGIAAKNSGTIDGCVVEFYNFKNGTANKFGETGGTNVAGGIVGLVEQTSSVIQNSYVYDYTLSTENRTLNISANTKGAIVGNCEGSAENSKISNSFAVVNIQNIVGSGTFDIADCYSGYFKLSDTEWKYSVNKKVTNDELWINDGDENFNANTNGGFSHLKFAQSEKVNISTIEFKDSNQRFIKVDGTTAILYLYEIDVARILNNTEKASLKNKNTYNLSDLFNLTEEAIDYVVVSSENENLANAQLGKLEITNVGETQITLLSKQDFSTEKTFTIKVIHIIDDFKASYNGLETTGVEVQEGRNAQIDFTIKEKTYLNSAEEFNLVLDNIQIKAEELADDYKAYISYSVENRVGSVNVKSGAKEHFSSFIINNYIAVEGLDEKYNDAIKGIFNKDITVIPFEGTNYIMSDYSAIPLYPSLSSTFEITLGTDSKTDDLLISIYKDDTKLQVWKDNGGDFEQISSRTINVGEGGTYVFAFGDTTKRIQLKISRKDYDEINKEYVYQFVISVCDDYKSSISTSEDYTLSLSSKNDKENEFGKNIQLTLESQKIDNIEMTNYTILQVVNNNGKLSYTRSNNSVTLVAPGASSILEVNIDPTYSYYEYLTISYVPQNNQLLTFTPLDKNGVVFTPNLSSNISSITNGLLWTPSQKQSSFAFKVYVSANIKTDCVFPITVSFYGYDESNNIILLESRQLSLYVTCVAQPQILVNGSEFTMLAKGSSADVEVTLESDQNLESLSFEGSVNGVALSTVAIVDNQDGTKTYKYKLNAKVTSSVNGGLGQFGVKATVSRVLNGVRETKSMIAYVALVELEISSVSIVNAEYDEEKQIDIVTAYENITRNFEFDYEFNPLTYGNSLSTEEEQAVYGENGLNAKRLSLKSQGYLEDNYYHINYTYDKEKDIWKEILFKDQLYIVGNSGREQKIVWTALDDNTYSYTHYEGNYAKFKLTFNKEINKETNKETYKFTIVGNSTTSGLVQMRIKTVQYITSAGKDIYWESSYDFAVQVKSYTSEDSPEAINNAKDFLDIQNEGEAKPYILMNDIVLEDYVPFDTSLIQSLDGNGYTIYLNSFDISAQETNLQLALFTNINANTILKNVRVNLYNGGQISVDTNDFTNVEIAGLAISNDGIIYNCEVVSFYNGKNNKKLSATENGIVVKYKRGSTEITIDGNYNITSRVAGFVLDNSGNITNSRVGGTEIDVINETAVGNAYYKTVELGTFTIKAQGEVSGFVSSNTKNIISSKASNMQITNESNYNKFETAGFVNTNSGKIKSSYITGLEDGKYTFAFLSTSIESNGIIAGFVVNNEKSAQISDCMTNIKISTSSLFGAGFVYKNEGEIIYAYSASQVESSSFTQMGFTGLDAEGNLLSEEGKISFSYYYDMDYTAESDVETSLDTGATALILQDSNNEKLYYGFSFASGDNEEERRENADGIWYFREDGKISIVSADTIAHSVRYIAGREKDNSYIYVYSDMINNDTASVDNGKRFTTELGSKYNPIIIATADDFDEAMGTSKSTNISKYFNSNEVFGSYRFVDDIDFDELDKNSEGGANVSSTSKSLVSNDNGIGLIDGNGFAIKNLSITSSADSSIGGIHSFGLFSKILNGAKVLNLTLEVTNVTASDVYVVGSLAGLVYNSTIVGIHVDQKYLITPETSPESSENGVKGQNIAGGIVGAVIGTSKIKDVSIEDALVQVSYYDSLRQYGKTDANYYLKTFNSRVIRTNLLSSISNLSVFNQLSIAGGVAGYIDTFNEDERLLMKYEHKEDTSRTFRVVNISATSTVNVRGEVVGGLIGYTSETTNTENARLVLSIDEENGTLVSKILSYNSYAGGITGLASGYYFRVYTTHEESTQDNIESGYYEYYNGTGEETTATRGILDIFYTLYDGTISYDYNTQVIGGIVGTFVAGEIENSYSKINVIAKTASKTTAGGIVGRVADSGEKFTYQLEISNGNSVATSLLLKEVYVTGDVRGGFTNDAGVLVGFGGGIAGQVDRQASLSLLAVNAVNAFGYKDITTSTAEGASEQTGKLSSVGVYALAGGKEASRGTINILTAPSYDSNGEKSTEGVSAKSVGYFDYVLNNNGEKIKIDLVDGNQLRIEYIGKKNEKLTKNDGRIFKIESVSEFTDVEDGFNSVLPAFTVGKHWNPNNWKSVRTKIYPEIRFSAIKTYLFLDNINVVEVTNKMRYSDVVVYVRGLNDDGTYSDVDFTKENINIGTIEGFRGQIIGPEGWLSVEEKEKGIIARTSFQGEYVGIIINKSAFSNVGVGFTSRDLRVECNATSATGSIYVSGRAKEISISDMTFNINKECKISPVGGSVGVICSSVKDSSITNTKININNKGTDENHKGKIIIDSKSSESVLNIGLYAGTVEVGSKNQYDNNSVAMEKDTETLLTITVEPCEELNVGGLFGYVTKYTTDTTDTSDTSIQISGLDIKNLISIEGNLSNTTANVGGQVGKMVDVKTVKNVAVTVNDDNYIEILSTGKINQLNYGGIIGYVSGLGKFDTPGFGEDRMLAKTKFKYKTGESGSKINAGGLFGSLFGIAGSQISLGSENDNNKVKASFKIGNAGGAQTAEGAIGGIVGQIGQIESLKVQGLDMEFVTGQYNDSSKEFNDGQSMTGINAHIGGIIGQNSEILIINNVNVSGTINAGVDETHYVGGYVGRTTKTVYVNCGKNESGDFDPTVRSGNSDVSINIVSSAGYIGGVVSYIDENATTYIYNTLYSGTIQVYETAKDKNHSIGGIVGFVHHNSETLTIANSFFGGNIIAKGDEVTFEGGTQSQNITETLAKLTIGGIIGDMNYSETTKRTKDAITISNCISYGDAIIRYANNFKEISAYNFGGIVGEANNVAIDSCGAFMMNNNSRTSTTYNVSPFVGVKNGSTTFTNTNLYSSALCLCVENDTNCTDIAYNTAFKNSETEGQNATENEGQNAKRTTEITGYKGSDSTETAFKYINKALETAGINASKVQGSKLYPYTTNEEIKAQTPIVYVVMITETKLGDNNIKIEKDLKKAKINDEEYGYYSALAFIGDGFTVGIKNTDTDTGDKVIFKEMRENDVVSSVVVNAELEYDMSNTDSNSGVIAHYMEGGIIYATGVYGSLSVGGVNALSVGGLVGNVENGLIAESYSSVDVIYRAGSGGKVSGFANAKTGYVTILNSYSTGKVATYIDVPAYAFSYIDGANINVENCYTISPVDINDYTKADALTNATKVFGRGDNGTYTNCYNDKNAVNDKGSDNNTNGINLTTIKDYTNDNIVDNVNQNPTLAGNTNLNSGNFVTLRDYNYGYPMRNFGFLQRKTIITDYYILSEDENATTGKKYYKLKEDGTYEETTFIKGSVYELLAENCQIIPNATKLNQISSNLSGNYILEYDIDLSTTENYKNDSDNVFINVTFKGKLYGNGKTINGLKYAGLFSSISGAKIDNLRLTNVAISSSGTVGAIAQTSTGTTLLNKISVNGEIKSANAGETIGGLVGTSSGSLTITNSQNYIRLVGKNDSVEIGGFVGNSESGTLTLTKCVNYGTIEAQKSGTIGGLVGLVNSGTLIITNCGNTNSVMCGYTDTQTTINYIAGGIVGHLKTSSANISKTYNSAMVKAGHKKNGAGTSCYAAAGGIVGLQDDNGSHIENCLNQGPIEALGTTDHMTTDFAVSGSGENSTITFTYKGNVNVYADAFANCTSDGEATLANSDSKNEASVFRNGCFGNKTLTKTGFKFEVDGGKKDGFEYRNNLKENVDKTRWSYIAGYKIGSASDVTGVYVTQTDDLGAPTSFFITVPRTIYYPKDEGNYTDGFEFAFTRKQEIYAKDEIAEADTYYALAHKANKYTGSGTSIEELDESSDLDLVTIAGKDYAVADTGAKLYNSLNANLYTTDPIFVEYFTYSETIKEMLDEGYKFSVKDITCTNSGVESVFGVVKEIDKLDANGNEVADGTNDTLSITFKYICQDGYTVTNPKISYTLVAENPNEQKVEVSVGPSSLGYEKVSVKVYDEENSTSDIPVYETKEYWGTVIYLNNLFKEQYVEEKNTNGTVKTDTDGNIIYKTDKNGNSIPYTDYFKENMTDGSTYKVTVNQSGVEAQYNMLYDSERNMFINYNSNVNWVTTWNGATISWDINQNKTLTATKTIVGITSEFTEKKGTADIDYEFEKEYTLSGISTSGINCTFTGDEINFDDSQTKTETATLTELSKTKEYNKNENIDDYISGVDLTEIDVNGYKIEITPYYKKGSYSTNMQETYTVTTKYSTEIDGATVNITYSGGNFIINGTTVASGGTWTSSESKSYKFEYVNGNCKITATDNGETFNKTLTPTYEVTLKDEATATQFTYNSGKFKIDGSEFASVYTTTDYTYKFTYNNGAVTVQRVTFKYTYNFDINKTKELDETKSNIVIDSSDANWKSEAKEIKSKSSTLNGTIYHRTYGTATAEYTFDKSKITISQSGTTLTLKVTASVKAIDIEKTTPSDEDWINGKAEFFKESGDSDKFYFIFTPTAVTDITNTSGNNTKLTPQITINYNITKVLAQFNVANKTETNTYGNLTVYEKNIALQKIEYNDKENKTQQLAVNNTYQELDVLSEYKVTKTYKVGTYSAKYIYNEEIYKKSEGKKGFIEITDQTCTKDTTISVYGGRYVLSEDESEKSGKTYYKLKEDGTYEETTFIKGSVYEYDDGSRYITDGSYIQLNINTGIKVENYDVSKTDKSSVSAVGYEAVEEYSATAEIGSELKIKIKKSDYKVSATIGSDDSSSSLIIGSETATNPKVVSAGVSMQFDIKINNVNYSGIYTTQYTTDEGKTFKQYIKLTGKTVTTAIKREPKYLSKDGATGLFSCTIEDSNYSIVYNPKTNDVYFKNGDIESHKYEDSSGIHYLSLISVGTSPIVELITIGSESKDASISSHSIDKDKSISHKNRDSTIVDVTLTFDKVTDPAKLAYALQLENIQLKKDENDKETATSGQMTGKITEKISEIKENFNETSFKTTVLTPTDGTTQQVSEVSQKSSDKWDTDGQYSIVGNNDGTATIKVYPNEKAVKFILTYKLLKFEKNFQSVRLTTKETPGDNSISGIILTADVDMKDVADGISECKNLSGNGYNITYRANKNEALVSQVKGFVKDVNIGGTNIVTNDEKEIGFFANEIMSSSNINNVKTYGSIVYNPDKPQGSFTGFVNTIDSDSTLANITTSVNIASYYDEYMETSYNNKEKDEKYLYQNSNKNSYTTDDGVKFTLKSDDGEIYKGNEKFTYSTYISTTTGNLYCFEKGINYNNSKYCRIYKKELQTGDDVTFTPLTNSIANGVTATTIQNYGTIIGYDGKNANTNDVAQVGQSITGTQIGENNIITNNGIIKAGDGGNGYANYEGNFTGSTYDKYNTQIAGSCTKSNAIHLNGVTVDNKATVTNFNGTGVMLAGNIGKDAKQGITGAWGVNKETWFSGDICLNDGKTKINITKKDTSSHTTKWMNLFDVDPINNEPTALTKIDGKDNEYNLSYGISYEVSSHIFGKTDTRKFEKSFLDSTGVYVWLYYSNNLEYGYWSIGTKVCNKEAKIRIYASEGITGCAGITYATDSSDKTKSASSRTGSIGTECYYLYCEASSGTLAKPQS